MSFYSAQTRALRRLSIAPQGSEIRLGRHIAERIVKQSTPSIVTVDEQERKEPGKDQKKDDCDQHQSIVIRSSSLVHTPLLNFWYTKNQEVQQALLPSSITIHWWVGCISLLNTQVILVFACRKYLCFLVFWSYWKFFKTGNFCRLKKPLFAAN